MRTTHHKPSGSVARLLRHVAVAIQMLVLLAIVQVVVQSGVFALLFRGELRPPPGFFSTQVHDVFTKAGAAGGGGLPWLPDAPEHFAGPSALQHALASLDGLPLAVAIALLAGGIAGVVGAAASRGREPRPTTYLRAAVVVGLGLHLAIAAWGLLALGGGGPGGVVDKLPSLVVEGALVAVGVLLLSAGLARVALGAMSGPSIRLLTGTTAVAVIGAQLVGPSGWFATTVEAATPEASAPAPPAAARERPNVLFISLDSLRADHVGAYGYPRDTTPALDRVAEEGVRFADAVATSSWTLPTHLSMFTGRYQLEHGVTADTLALPRVVPTLGELLAAHGYATGGFFSGPYLGGHYGFDRGMDTYVDLSGGDARSEGARRTIVAPAVTEAALDWLDANHDRPFFLFAHYFDIHYDYIPPPPYDRMFDPDYEGEMNGRDFLVREDVHAGMNPGDLDHILALYDGEIRFTDDHVGRVLARLDELGLRSSTLVVILADHGDEFFEHGSKGHNRTLYQEVLRVPFVMRLPDGAHAGRVVDEPVSLVDVMPTILAVAGIEAPPGMSGIPLLAALEGNGRLEREAVYGELYAKHGLNVQVARRTARHKVIQHFARILHPRRPSLEYYERATDPREQANLASRDPEAAEPDLEKLASWLDGSWRVHREIDERAPGDREVELDDQMLEQLEALGYVDG